MRVLSLFSGIGAFEKALKRIGLEYELVNYCEIDKHASKSYSQVHNVDEDLNLWDVRKVDTSKLPEDIDLITYGFPCQDISLAGKQKGLFNEDGSQTRSGLFFEALRIIENTKPKIAIAENVKNLTSKKFNAQFQIVLSSLEEAGYNNYWQVLNAKDYGIPQNRERVFIISIRKDIDKGKFEFPEPFELKLRLKDVLEDKVEEKYYLNCDLHQDNLEGIYNLKEKAEIIKIDIPQIVKVRKYPVDCKLLCECLRNHKASSKITNKELAAKLNIPLTKVEHWFRQDNCFAIPDPDVWFNLKELLEIETTQFDESIMTFEEREGVYEKSNRCYFAEGIAPTITCASANEKIIVKESVWTETQAKMITSDGDVKRYLHNDIIDKFEVGQAADISFPNGYNKANRVHDTMPALNNTTTKSSFVYKDEQRRIRKLTAKDCYRLMGFDDEDFEKAAQVNSDSQLYKQAGNSIVVNVLEVIFKKLKPYFKKDKKFHTNNY